MKSRHVVSSFSYSIDDDATIKAFQRIADREHKKFSPLLVEAIFEYVKAHTNGNKQFTLEKSTEEGFEAFPTLGEKNHREKLEKMSDEDIATIAKYAYQWYMESEAHLRRIGYRESDIRNVKTGGWPALVAAVKESKRVNK